MVPFSPFNAPRPARKSCQPKFTGYGRSVRRSRGTVPKTTHFRANWKSGQVDIPIGLSTCPLLIEIVIGLALTIGCSCHSGETRRPGGKSQRLDPERYSHSI